MLNTNKHIIFLALLLMLVNSCREPFEPDSIEFLDALVVEATITNELKHHEVKISRTYRLEDSEPAAENNATVIIQDSNNTIYSFSQNQEGIYISDVEFQAQENTSYKLTITTQEGKEYNSTNVFLTPISDITNLYAETTTRNDGSLGVQVMVDSDNSNGEAQYFRYEYEETYKVIAPSYSSLDLLITNFTQDQGLISYDREIVTREQEERVCFTTKYSTGINQASLNDLENNVVSRHPIRFIDAEDDVLLNRYSILVKQYVQSLEAYSFYSAINSLGSVQSILSQTQPGYVAGNITSLNNNGEKVLGYFDIATVSEERIYFNYTDFNLPQPPYFYECNELDLDYLDNSAQDGDPNERVFLYQLINIDNYKLRSYGGTVYTIVNPECGDCTSISSNIRPDFWED